MPSVKIKENSPIAYLAAKKLNSPQLAIVIGNTIHLHNTPASSFLSTKRWLIHELKHVDQFCHHGFLPFLWKYLVESIRNGYYMNKYEVEARTAETDESLLHKYQIVK